MSLLCPSVTCMYFNLLIYRYIRCLRYGWKSRSKPEDEKYHNSMVYEWRDLTMLRLLEAFLESAPQLVLQVYIMTQKPRVFWLTGKCKITLNFLEKL